MQLLQVMATAASKGQDRYRVYTNAKHKYTTYGSSLGITYNFYKRFTISGNVNYNNIKGNATPDLFVTGFNTPELDYQCIFWKQGDHKKYWI